MQANLPQLTHGRYGWGGMVFSFWCFYVSKEHHRPTHVCRLTVPTWHSLVCLTVPLMYDCRLQHVICDCPNWNVSFQSTTRVPILICTPYYIVDMNTYTTPYNIYQAFRWLCAPGLQPRPFDQVHELHEAPLSRRTAIRSYEDLTSVAKRFWWTKRHTN